jgi:hypothetical protein
VIGFDGVVRILLGNMQCRRDKLVKDRGVGRCPVGGGLGRDGTCAQRAGEEPAGGCQVAPIGWQHVDELAVLINGPIEITPLPGHLDVRLVSELPVTGSMTAGRAPSMNSRVNRWTPPIDGDVIDGDTVLSQQFLHVAVGQAIPQVPADRDRDHLGREPEASEH